MTIRVPRPPFATTELYKPHGVNACRLVVLHDTEGGSPSSVVGTLRKGGLGIHWIAGQNGAVIRGNPSEQIVEHVAGFNDEAIGIEQCGFAAYRRSRWMDNDAQLLVVAWIVAWECQRHGIPCVLGRGVTTHSRLGAAGGGHHDPGDGYPLSHVLGMADSILTRGLGIREKAGAILHAHGRLG